MRLLYSVLVYLLLPLALVYLAIKSIKQPAYRRNLGQRLGLSGPDTDQPLIWIHGASVGEITAATPLIRRLLQTYPEHAFLVSTVTPTGMQRARETFADTVSYSYLPLDAGLAVRGFLKLHQPALAVIMETEIWPNLYRELDASGVPVVIASGRLSQRSVDGYGRFRGLIEEVLSGDVYVAAQTDEDAARFVSVGASSERTSVTGNIKFDIDLADDIAPLGLEFRDYHGCLKRPVWVAGSTHAGEEEQLLEAHQALLKTQPDALLILVPRHPERFDEVANIVRKSGLSGVRRSSNQICDPRSQVLLGDTMGELMCFYAAADVAFVGGSLVDIGGHNLLEPAALGMPVLTGPSVQNAPDVAAMLIAAGGLQTVSNSMELIARLQELFERESSRQELAKRALKAISDNRGAVDRVLEVIRLAKPTED